MKLCCFKTAQFVAIYYSNPRKLTRLVGEPFSAKPRRIQHREGLVSPTGNTRHVSNFLKIKNNLAI